MVKESKLQDPTLTQVIKEAIRSQILELHTAIPGKVLEYDESVQKAKIQPLLKRKFKTEEGEVELPIINSVPVSFPRTENSIIHIPVAVGTLGMIIFCERSIDSWLSGEGGCVSPDDPRTHDLSDGIFYPGLYPFSKAISGLNSTYTTIKNNNMKIELSPDGKIAITGGSEELVSVLSDLADHVLTFIGNVKVANILVGSGSSAGPWPFTPADIVKFTTDEGNITSDKSKLDGFKI